MQTLQLAAILPSYLALGSRNNVSTILKSSFNVLSNYLSLNNIQIIVLFRSLGSSRSYSSI